MGRAATTPSIQISHRVVHAIVRAGVGERVECVADKAHPRMTDAGLSDFREQPRHFTMQERSGALARGSVSADADARR